MPAAPNSSPKRSISAVRLRFAPVRAIAGRGIEDQERWNSKRRLPDVRTLRMRQTRRGATILNLADRQASRDGWPFSQPRHDHGHDINMRIPMTMVMFTPMARASSRPRPWASRSRTQPRSRSPFDRDVVVAGDAHPRQERRAWRRRIGAWFAGREILALNLVSSPGAGKTTLLERTIRDLQRRADALCDRRRPGDRQRRRTHPRGGRAGGAGQHRHRLPSRSRHGGARVGELQARRRLRA